MIYIYYKNIEFDNIDSFEDPTFSIRIVDSCGKALFECKLTVTLVCITIEHDIQPIYELGTVLGLCRRESLAIDPQQ